MNLVDILNSENLAKELEESQLAAIADQVKRDYDTDCRSREGWEDSYIKWQKLVNQVVEAKTHPWKGAANIKYPLLTQAALNFNARIMPAMMPNNEPVGIEVHGEEEKQQRTQIAQAVSHHMNYQLTTEMDEWEEETDGMFMALCVSGNEYKKTYFDPLKGRNCSRHVTPLNLVINYNAKNMEEARKTERHRWTRNYIVGQIASGRFAEVDWESHPDPTPGEDAWAEQENAANIGMEEPSTVDSASPYLVLEQHTWLDLDEDGYEEPYIVTMIHNSMEVLEISPRFDATTITATEEEEVIHITPYESYTKYGFIPNPDGSFYDIGFGQLLYPLNATVNTAINMMLDAGASSIMNSGFIGRGVKMRGGMFRMEPNKWFQVNAMGDDIRKNFVPMPAKGPDQVLLSLMMYMVEAGQKLSSTTDIFSGEMPGQNTKTGVTQAVRDEGQKIFTGIYKRIRRAFKRELFQLYELNGLILNSEQGQGTKVAKSATVFGVQPEFYNRDMVNIQPSADPNMAIKEQKVQQALTARQAIMETGIGDIVQAQRDLFTVMEANPALIPEDAQQPGDPMAEVEAQKAQFEMQMQEREMQFKEEKAAMDAILRMAELQLQAKDKEDQAILNGLRLKLDERVREDEREANTNERPMGGMEGQPSNGMGG